MNEEYKKYVEFRIQKLEKLLIPTIKEEIEKLRGSRSPEIEHYNLLLFEHELELQERRKRYDSLV